MRELPYTDSNVLVIQEFLDETRSRIRDGIEITFTNKAQSELAELNIAFDISTEDIEYAILNLTIENYYRGIDPSGKSDFNVCAFYTEIGVQRIGVYLKYGLEVKGLQILIFSNHPPLFPMVQLFKK